MLLVKKQLKLGIRFTRLISAFFGTVYLQLSGLAEYRAKVVANKGHFIKNDKNAWFYCPALPVFSELCGRPPAFRTDCHLTTRADACRGNLFRIQHNEYASSKYYEQPKISPNSPQAFRREPDGQSKIWHFIRHASALCAANKRPAKHGCGDCRRHWWW